MNRERRLTSVGRAGSLGLMTPSLFLVAALAVQVPAQTILIDDFDDRDANGWTTFDWTIEQPWGPGTFDAGSGAFHLEGAGLVPDIWGGGPSVLGARWEPSSDPMFTDGFVRAKVSVHELGGAAGLWLRGGDHINEPGSGSSYGFFGDTAWPNFFFIRNSENAPAHVVRLPSNLSFGVNEEWYIEAGAVGNQLSMKVWRVGDPEPESPQWTGTDRTLHTGSFGIAAFVSDSWNQSARTSATIDDIQFRFPEHDDVYTVSPYNIYLWDSPMPVPQVEGPFFVADSPEKLDMRGDVSAAEGWPDLHLTGQVTDVLGRPIPELRLDFWQADDKGNYDNSGGYDLRGHIFTDVEGNYELWTVMPSNYEVIRTRHLHLKIGGENLDFDSPVYTTQVYFPVPYDSDINADGIPDLVIQDGVETEFIAITVEEDFITLADVETVGAEFSDLASNTVMVNNDPAVDGYFDATLDIVMPEAFQSPEMAKRILIDNFNDGNDDGWEHADNTVQALGPGPAIFDASSGAYRLASTGAFWNVGDIRHSQNNNFAAVLDTLWGPELGTSIASSSDLLFYSHGLFRFRFRIDGNATRLTFKMRAKQVQPNRWSFYTFGATSLAGSQDPEDDPVFVFRKQVAGVGKDELLQFGEPRLGEEWMLEAGAIGDRLTMKWWPVGEPEPAEPQWEWIDPDPLPPGIFYMEVVVDRPRIVATGTPPPWLIDATVDDLYFTPSDVDTSRSRRR